MSLLERIEACHRWTPEAYLPLVIGSAVLGRLRFDLVRRLRDFPRVFRVGAEAVELDPALDDFAARSEAVAEVMRALSEAGEVGRWRGEDYTVVRRWGDPPVMKLDRGVVPDMGVRGFGVHLNGLVEGPEGLSIWVGKRALDKPTAPGKLDHIVAGGQPHGLGIRENLVKECAEEAAIPAELAAQAVAAGAVAYRCERAEGLRDDVLFCFDLSLPAGFTPVNTDGEVSGFFLWPVDQVIERLRETDDFKFNVALVTIHLLVRRGLIGPDDPDYQTILDGLWRAD